MVIVQSLLYLSTQNHKLRLHSIESNYASSTKITVIIVYFDIKIKDQMNNNKIFLLNTKNTSFYSKKHSHSKLLSNTMAPSIEVRSGWGWRRERLNLTKFGSSKVRERD